MSKASPPPRENLLLSIALNVIVPSVLLFKGKEWLGLEPVPLLLAALLFPLSYGFYDLKRRKKWSIFTTIGLVSVLITGGIGIFELPKELVAWNEALPPFLFGVAILLSMFTRKSLIGEVLYNPDIFDVPKIEAALVSRGTQDRFAGLLRKCTVVMATSLFLAAVLNFALARFFVHSESGTEAFNVEIGKMKAWSFPCITLPSMIVSYLAVHLLLKGIKNFAGLEMEDVMHAAQPKEKPEPKSQG